MAYLLLLLVLLAPAAGVASGLYTGGWRRVLVRVAWRAMARKVGAANRKDRIATKKKGPGEKVSMTQAVEHLPILWGAFGRPIGPYTDRVGARWRIWAADGTTIAQLQTKAVELCRGRSGVMAYQETLIPGDIGYLCNDCGQPLLGGLFGMGSCSCEPKP